MTKKQLDKYLKQIETKINKLDLQSDNNKKYFDIEKKILEDKTELTSSESETSPLNDSDSDSESETESNYKSMMYKIKSMKKGLKKYN
jgi:hypothetical protein